LTDLDSTKSTVHGYMESNKEMDIIIGVDINPCDKIGLGYKEE